SWDTTLKIWDIISGEELISLVGHTKGVTAVAVTPDGNRAVSASEDQTLKVWDTNTGTELFTLKGHQDWVTAIAVTPDGRRAISGAGSHAQYPSDTTLKVWDLEYG